MTQFYKETNRIDDNESITRLGFPSLSTTHGKIPVDDAVRIACEVIKEFLSTRKGDQSFELVLVEQDSDVVKAFELQWKKCEENEVDGESRFQIRNGNLNRSKSEIGIEYATILSKQLFDEIGPKLLEEIKRLYPKTGVVGESYPVPLPSDTYQRGIEGVEQIIYVVSPNMNPSRTDPLSLDEAKNFLFDSYRSMLNAFWSLKNGVQPISKAKGPEKQSIFETMMASARNLHTKSTGPASKSTAKRSSSSHSGHWSNVLLRYCDHPETLSAEELYYYDDEYVIIWDQYPKAKKHLLIMPRKRIDSIGELRREDLGLVRGLKEKGRWVIER
ncbi:12146_t:CDS:2 [Acaulospora colombiana]|uniref:12146_t:CDS:1 n=1 Tax=Acaulospora colombiana TaxID=27376 RepID=A0ACA9KD50_9GLOM|nr:12146_t:CDS:2 [Acaulospora colombiana]